MFFFLVVRRHPRSTRTDTRCPDTTRLRSDLGGIGRLRHPLRADEAGGFDRPQASGRQAVDQLDLGRGGNDGLLVLQAVAWADLDDADAGGQGHAQVSSVTRLASASTNSPSAVRTCEIGRAHV